MSLVQCPKCKVYSESINFCIHCGFPLRERQNSGPFPTTQEGNDPMEKQELTISSEITNQFAAQKVSEDNSPDTDIQTRPDVIPVQNGYDETCHIQVRNTKWKIVLNLVLVYLFFALTAQIVSWLFHCGLENDSVQYFLFNSKVTRDFYFLFILLTHILLGFLPAGFAFMAHMKGYRKTAVLLSALYCSGRLIGLVENLIHMPEISFSIHDYLVVGCSILVGLLLLLFTIKSTPGQESKLWLLVYLGLELFIYLVRFVLSPTDSSLRFFVDESLAISKPAIIIGNIISVLMMAIGFAPAQWFRSVQKREGKNAALMFQILAAMGAVGAFICQLLGILTVQEAGADWMVYSNKWTAGNDFVKAYKDIISTHQSYNVSSICCSVIFAIFAILLFILMAVKTIRSYQELKHLSADRIGSNPR